jgi:catechol-2,3-dioxygenase
MAGIAKLRAVVLDCPEPVGLAEFYGALVGGEIDASDDGEWVTLRDGGDVLLAFQQVEDYKAPDWPGSERPQQFHIDVTVEDIETAEKQVLALGATKHAVQPGADDDENWRVYVDPAGHPFCLCWD